MLANTITADTGLIPGFAFVGPGLGLPLSLLAAFIERPFYSAGGVRANAIWYSLQANLVSLAAGFVLCLAFGVLMAAVGLQASDAAFFIAWPIVAVFCSVLIERMYIASRSPRLSWAWTAAGNILSAGICVAILFSVVWVRARYPGAARVVRPYNTPLNVLALAGSAIVYVISFVVPRRRRKAGESATT
jgi:hypothetical protein